ncbi:serine/threonine-protein kinase [Nocardiopsis dassonvillei]|uniref:Serine/threonine protein kinase n=2 Tax=Nocardiopsis dassonvillei TaxID=2014 RepID=D7AWU7_NOCDD|nr:serine/threonine-protein kinase [Nocardiopsis dassonvillei]ADH67894.1 serine/threonine protein kinase [Nocardiopsis dassonvillei subsp. dassonvillei DSM 43111]VEI88394.1 Serine/threonine-protein kinase AfsK [Nocardiopsis dassonvillei]
MTVTPAPVPPPPRDTGLPPGLEPLEKGDPRTLGPYRIVGRIGAGGMGAVYGGIDGSGRCVAVKTVHARFARGRGHREAFAREVDMLARARGVSTARLYDADTTARVPWLAFDYVPGRNLRAHVRAFGPLEGEMLRAFAAGTAEGLAALHSAGIVHRDIKPGNVILSPDGPKIVDFGIATAVGTTRANDRGASYGTPGWVAPERYTGAVADPAADVFAWGALVALAATGREPFGRGTPEQLRQRVTAGQHDLAGVPDDVLPLVEAALANDPARRPRAVELMRALLPEPEEVGLSGRGGPVPAAETLRALLRGYWRGVDSAGHDPAAWATAVGVLSAAGITAGALGGAGAGTGGAAGAATGTTAAGAAGGTLTALAGAKAAVVGAGVLVAAGLATGGYVVYDRVSGAPAEAVTAAATTLEEGGGFVVEVERRFSDAHAEEVAARTGQAVEAVLEESTATVEYRYAADRDVFLASGEVMGQGSVAAADSGGRLYVYGPALAEGEASEPVEPAWEATAEDLGPELVTGPLRTMAESPDLEAGGAGEEGGRVYTGPLTSRLVVDGEVVEEDARGLVEVDERGGPVRMEYAGALWRVRADFTEVGGPVEVVDPQQGEESGGGRLEVLHAPACGEFEFYERVWQVRADAWEMSCDRALEVAGLLGSEGGRSELALGYTGTGVHTHFVDGELACVGVRESVPGLSGAESPWSLVSCTSATSVGESEFGWEELEFGESVLIRFVRVE